MRCLACVIALLVVVVPSSAADAPKPNTLTAKEIADGWLLRFDGETTFGWNIDGEASVKDGTLVLGGGKKEVVARVFLPSAEFYFEYRIDGPNSPDYALTAPDDPEGTKSKTGLSSINSRQAGKPAPWCGHRVTVQSQRDTVGSSVEFAPAPADSGLAHMLKSQASFPGGKYLLTIRVAPDSPLALRNFKMRPLGLQSIFNGKDLSGWNVYKGDPKREQSKFTVTKEGWLNIKDGPGDLQTVGEWGDFVLQFDCISNGKHLNSGVFFRCRPSEYQQGYEAQVRNQFTAEPTQKYVIEEYDPKTGELKGKKDVTSTAVDYGTGAIYRRVPARKEMSKDGEWFTMTVLANGRHLATWVNGVQVTDWTDHRPLKDNARNGCRLEKGPISLQGHDPTTDLSFRNIRIAELAPKK